MADDRPDFDAALRTDRLLAAERRTWQAERKDLEDEYRKLEQLLTLTTLVESKRGRRIRWSTGKAKPGRHQAVPCFLFSDWHFDEVVRSEEMNGVNAYNRRIAEARLERWTDKACSLPRELLPSYDYDNGCVLLMTGDIINGEIHPELRRTNADTVAGTVAHWLDPLSAMARALADTYGKVRVFVVAGNHGRNPLEHRDPAKFYARDNFDTLIGWLLARDFRDDERVEFTVAESIEQMVTIYGTRILQYHGQAKGGSGIAGALSPLLLLAHRKNKVQSAIGEPFDVIAIGHWHTYMHLPGQGLIVNGSGKGFDEYAKKLALGFEPPQQAFWLVTPEQGITVSLPIRVATGRKAEGW